MSFNPINIAKMAFGSLLFNSINSNSQVTLPPHSSNITNSLSPTKTPSFPPFVDFTLNPTTLKPVSQPTYLTNHPSKTPSDSPTKSPTLYPSQNPSSLKTNHPSFNTSNFPSISQSSISQEDNFNGISYITIKGTEILITPLINNYSNLQRAASWLNASNITKSAIYSNETLSIGKMSSIKLKVCTSSYLLYDLNPSSFITKIQVLNPEVGLILLIEGNLYFFPRNTGSVNIAYSLAGSDNWYISNFTVPLNAESPSFLGIERIENDFYCYGNSSTFKATLNKTDKGIETPAFSFFTYGKSPCFNSSPIILSQGQVLLKSYAMYSSGCESRDVSYLGTWVSSNTSVAIILQNGTLIPLKVGSVTIYFFKNPCVILSNRTNSQYEIQETVANINTFKPQNNVSYDLNFMVSMSCSANFVIQ